MSALTATSVHTQSPTLRLPLLLALLGLSGLICVSLLLGRYPLTINDMKDLLQYLWSQNHPLSTNSHILLTIITQSRLPRILAAIIIGAGLAIAGTAFQAVFRNPLVSPGLLGVLNGCAFGAALGMVYHVNIYGVSLLAVLTGLIAVIIGLLIARSIGGHSILYLLLGGIISNALFAGLLALVKYIADPQEQLPSIIFWLLGSLSSVSIPLLTITAPIIIIASTLLMLLGRILDVISLGDDEALSLGIPVVPLRYGIIFLATIISALTVCLAGIIGWIGLLIPHLTRLIFGANHRLVLPLSAILGACFLLVADDIARLISNGEIPLGVVTELLGAGIFFFLLSKMGRNSHGLA